MKKIKVKPAIGQRWLLKDKKEGDFIIEILSLGEETVKGKIIQDKENHRINFINSFFAISQKKDSSPQKSKGFCWSWHYLPGQDKL